MSAAKKHKRRPFGTCAENNALVGRKQSPHKARYSKPSPTCVKPRVKRKTSNTSKNQGQRGESAAVGGKYKLSVAQRDGAKHRVSRTPKTSNLRAAASAYDLRKRFDLSHQRGTKKSTERAARHRPADKPDPSPIKLPDPSTSNDLASKGKRSSKPTARDGATKRDNNFVLASLKRIFPLKDSTKNASKTKSIPDECPIDPSGYPAGRNHASSDMDTACSTPEKDSPLIKSPLLQLDPIAKDSGMAEGPMRPSRGSAEGIKRKENSRKVVKNGPQKSHENRLNAKSIEEEDPSDLVDLNPPGRHHVSSGKNMACASPEKDSPLIISPMVKLDPIAKDVEDGNAPGWTDKASKRMGHDIKKIRDYGGTAVPTKKERSENLSNLSPQGRHLASCSDPEKYSPLIMSPLTRIDPDGKEAGDTVVIDSKKETRGRTLHDAEGSKAPKGSLSNDEKTPFPSFAPQRKGNQDNICTDTVHGQPKRVLKDMLDRARNGPTDNKPVLEAMLKSGTGKPIRRPESIVNELAAEHLVGSFVGGTSLQRADSADESEITTINYNEDSSQVSMATRTDHGHTVRAGILSYRNGNSRKSGFKSNIFRNVAQSTVLNRSSSVPLHQELRRANTIEDGTQFQYYTQPTSTLLPDGWKVRWSNTKQKPYFVHPDFGSTWHCPGLTANGHVSDQNELYNDQRVFSGGHKVILETYQIPESNGPSHIAHSMCTVGGSIESSINRGASQMSKSVDGRHSAQYMQGRGSSSKSGAKKHTQKSADGSHVGHSSQGASSANGSIGVDLHGNTNGHATNIDTAKKTVRVEATKDSHSKHTSSADVSSKCLTQYFSSDGAASTFAHPEEEEKWDRKLQKNSLENNESEYHHDIDSNEFDNAHEGGIDDGFGDDESQGQSLGDENMDAKQHHKNSSIELDCNQGERFGEFGVGSKGYFDEELNQNGSGVDEFGDDESQGQSLDEEDKKTKQHYGSDSVKFDYSQKGGFDEIDDASRGYSDKKLDKHGVDNQEFDQTDESNDSILGTKSNQSNDGISSIASDHLDEITLQQNGKKKCKSRLPTIKELCDRSDGYQSDEDSLDDESADNVASGSRMSQKGSQHRDNSLGTSILDDGSVEKSAINDGASDGINSKSYAMNGSRNDDRDYESDGYDQSPIFQNNDVANDDFSTESDDEVESLDRGVRVENDKLTRINLSAEFRKEKTAPRGRRCKKKIFPPGPLCSLQFLEEIENREFDTPLWRRMKRKRSTLTSVKRGKAAKKYTQGQGSFS